MCRLLELVDEAEAKDSEVEELRKKKAQVRGKLACYSRGTSQSWQRCKLMAGSLSSG
jgi:hypothetical protein